MEGEHGALEGFELGAGGLEEQQDLGGVLKAALPPIMGLEAGNKIGAGGQAGAKDGLGQVAGGFAVGGGDEDDDATRGGGHRSGRAGIEFGEEALKAVEGLGLVGADIQDAAEIVNGVGDIADGAGQDCAGGVGMAAALKAFGDFDGFAVAGAEADDHGAVGFAEEGEEHMVASAAGSEELVDDEVVIADDGFDEADGGGNLSDIVLAPGEAEGVFDAALDGHDLEERMIQELLEVTAQQGVEVPELVGLDEVGVVGGEEEVGVVGEEEIADVVEMDEAVEGGRAEPVLAAELIAEEGGGLMGVVAELGEAGFDLGGVVIQDDPRGLIDAGVEGEIGHPGGSLAHLADAPVLVMEGLHGDFGSEESARQALEQHAGEVAVQIALMSQNDFRSGQFNHGATLAQGRAACQPQNCGVGAGGGIMH
jgi:hypothetical protein